MSAWVFRYYKKHNRPSPIMKILQEKLHTLNIEETKELAEEIGVSRVTLYNWRSGNIRHGSGLVLSLLCIHFGLVEAQAPRVSEQEKLELQVPKQQKKPTLKVHKGGRR